MKNGRFWIRLLYRNVWFGWEILTSFGVKRSTAKQNESHQSSCISWTVAVTPIELNSLCRWHLRHKTGENVICISIKVNRLISCWLWAHSRYASRSSKPLSFSFIVFRTLIMINLILLWLRESPNGRMQSVDSIRWFWVFFLAFI